MDLPEPITLYQIRDKWTHLCSVCLEETRIDDIPMVQCARCGCAVHCLCHGINLKAVNPFEDHAASLCSDDDQSSPDQSKSYSSSLMSAGSSENSACDSYSYSANDDNRQVNNILKRSAARQTAKDSAEKFKSTATTWKVPRRNTIGGANNSEPASKASKSIGSSKYNSKKKYISKNSIKECDNEGDDDNRNKNNKESKTSLKKKKPSTAKELIVCKEESELNAFKFLCEQCKLTTQNCCSICYQYGGIMKKLKIKTGNSQYLNYLSKLVFPQQREKKTIGSMLWAHPICFKLLRGIVFDPEWTELVLDGENQFDLVHSIFADSIYTTEFIDGVGRQISLSSILGEEWMENEFYPQLFQTQKYVLPSFITDNLSGVKFANTLKADSSSDKASSAAASSKYPITAEKALFFMWDSKLENQKKTLPWSFLTQVTNDNNNNNNNNNNIGVFINENSDISSSNNNSSGIKSLTESHYESNLTEAALSNEIATVFVTAKLIDGSSSLSSLTSSQGINNAFAIDAQQTNLKEQEDHSEKSYSNADQEQDSDDSDSHNDSQGQEQYMSDLEQARRNFYKSLTPTSFARIFSHKTCKVCGVGYGLLIKCECPDECDYFAHPSCMVLGREPFVEICSADFIENIPQKKKVFRFFIPNSLNYTLLAKSLLSPTKESERCQSGESLHKSTISNNDINTGTKKKGFISQKKEILMNVLDKKLGCFNKSQHFKLDMSKFFGVESHITNRELHQYGYFPYINSQNNNDSTDSTSRTSNKKDSEDLTRGVGRLIIQHLATTDRLIPLCENHAKQPWEEIEFQRNMENSGVYNTQYFTALRLHQLMEHHQSVQVSAINYFDTKTITDARKKWLVKLISNSGSNNKDNNTNRDSLSSTSFLSLPDELSSPLAELKMISSARPLSILRHINKAELKLKRNRRMLPYEAMFECERGSENLVIGKMNEKRILVNRIALELERVCLLRSQIQYDLLKQLSFSNSRLSTLKDGGTVSMNNGYVIDNYIDSAVHSSSFPSTTASIISGRHYSDEMPIGGSFFKEYLPLFDHYKYSVEADSVNFKLMSLTSATMHTSRNLKTFYDCIKQDIEQIKVVEIDPIKWFAEKPHIDDNSASDEAVQLASNANKELNMIINENYSFTISNNKSGDSIINSARKKQISIKSGAITLKISNFVVVSKIFESDFQQTAFGITFVGPTDLISLIKIRLMPGFLFAGYFSLENVMEDNILENLLLDGVPICCFFDSYQLKQKQFCYFVPQTMLLKLFSHAFIEKHIESYNTEDKLVAILCVNPHRRFIGPSDKIYPFHTVNVESVETTN